MKIISITLFKNNKVINIPTEYNTFLSKLVIENTEREAMLSIIHQGKYIRSYKNHEHVGAVIITDPEFPEAKAYGLLKKTVLEQKIDPALRGDFLEIEIDTIKDSRIGVGVESQTMEQLIGRNNKLSDLMWKSTDMSWYSKIMKSII